MITLDADINVLQTPTRQALRTGMPRQAGNGSLPAGWIESQCRHWPEALWPFGVLLSNLADYEVNCLPVSDSNVGPKQCRASSENEPEERWWIRIQP